MVQVIRSDQHTEFPAFVRRRLPTAVEYTVRSTPSMTSKSIELIAIVLLLTKQSAYRIQNALLFLQPHVSRKILFSAPGDVEGRSAVRVCGCYPLPRLEPLKSAK